MPALTIVSVDHTTDQIEITGHGLLTGAGPAAARNIGGALPAPLVALTDCWVIVVDANHVKLATSSANAMANIAIPLTTNGTGTNYLEIGIPYRRARTYVPKAVDAAGAQVKSADLNSKMDSLTALHALLTGQAQSVWTIELLEAPALYYTEEIPIIIPGARAVDPSAAHLVANSAGGYRIGHTLNASTAPIQYPIDGLRSGDIITRWEVLIDKVSVGIGTAYQGWIKSYDYGALTEGNETAGTGVINNGGLAGAFVVGETGLNVEVDDPVTAAKQYYLAVDPAAACAGDVLYQAYVWVKRPRP